MFWSSWSSFPLLFAFPTVCCHHISFSNGPSAIPSFIQPRMFLKWRSNGFSFFFFFFFNCTQCSKSCWISDSYWCSLFLYSIFLPWSFWLLCFFLRRWYIHLSHHIPNNLISYSFCSFLKSCPFPWSYFSWSLLTYSSNVMVNLPNI